MTAKCFNTQISAVLLICDYLAILTVLTTWISNGYFHSVNHMYFILETLVIVTNILLQSTRCTVLPSQIEGYSGSDVELINPLGFLLHLQYIWIVMSGFLLFLIFNQSIDDNA